MEQQQSQEGALLSPFQLERMPLQQDLELAEDAELDLLHLCRFTTDNALLLAPVLAARESHVRPAAEHGRMNSRAAADLVTEAERYLAAVAVFRAEGREPHWRLEGSARPRRRRASNSDLRDLLDPASRRLE
jgi:hypothetical protein